MFHKLGLSLLDLAGFEAGRAHAGPPGVGTVFDANSLDVGKPTSAGAFVREANLLPVPRLFSTDFTPV